MQRSGVTKNFVLRESTPQYSSLGNRGTLADTVCCYWERPSQHIWTTGLIPYDSLAGFRLLRCCFCLDQI